MVLLAVWLAGCNSDETSRKETVYVEHEIPTRDLPTSDASPTSATDVQLPPMSSPELIDDPATASSGQTPKVTPAPPIDLQDYIGLWIGYAIAVFEFLEIIDATEGCITFGYGWHEDEWKEHTLLVDDNRVSFLHEWTAFDDQHRSQLVTLEFFENRIVLSRFTLHEDEWMYTISWGLNRIEEFWNGYFASYNREELLRINISN